MLPVSLLIAALGLALAATLPARAAEVTLFGKKYDLVQQRRAETFKKADGSEVTIRVVPRDVGTQLANVHFVEGADPSRDRLFIGCNIASDDSVVAHQFYLLTGADANGLFTPASATLTEFFGGAQNRQRGGRPTGFMWLNDLDTGVGQDRNIAISTFWDVDYRIEPVASHADSSAVVRRVSRPASARRIAWPSR
jgi:hypothetical protein